MKLDLDCIKDILLDIEEMSDGVHVILISEYNYQHVLNYCKKYEYLKLRYHLQQCEMNGYFLQSGSKSFDDDFAILDLSPKAHDILAKISNEKIWKQLLRGVKEAAAFVLPMLPDLLNKNT